MVFFLNGIFHKVALHWDIGVQFLHTRLMWLSWPNLTSLARVMMPFKVWFYDSRVLKTTYQLVYNWWYIVNLIVVTNLCECFCRLRAWTISSTSISFNFLVIFRTESKVENKSNDMTIKFSQTIISFHWWCFI